MSKLIAACEALQDLNTLQVVRLPMVPPLPRCGCNGPCENLHPSCDVVEWLEQLLEKYVKGLGEWTVERLEKAKMGSLEGEQWKRITLRIVEFSYDFPVKVKEYEI